MAISPRQAEDVAELLADNIIRNGATTKDKAQCLIAAINATYGSLEIFYEQFFQFLDEGMLKDFGRLIDVAIARKQQARGQFSAIICSDLFRKIVSTFAKVNTSIAKDADHAKPISPHPTAVPYTPANTKQDKER